MTTKEVKQYLEKELPEFTYISGDETPHEENWNSIRVVRDDHDIILDISKVDNQEALVKLKVYLQDLWDRRSKVIDV